MDAKRTTLAWMAAVMACCAVSTVLMRQAAAEQYLELEPVLVTGERPGPALWKVSWRDHVLWILPTMAPLPTDVRWRSRQLEQLLAASQEVYTEASLDMRMGGHGSSDAAIEAALQNPDGKWVRDLMPPDLYARFATLNERYAGGDARLETYRPFYAALELRKRALQRVGLDSDGDLHGHIAYLTRKYEVPLRSLARELHPGARALTRSLKRIPAEADIECARSQLLQLQSELRDAIARANAWSIGDIEALRRDWEATGQQGRSASCHELFVSLAPTDRAVRETRDKGYMALQRALRRNRSTIALVLMEEVFDPDGVVARFRSAGYEVAEP